MSPYLVDKFFAGVQQGKGIFALGDARIDGGAVPESVEA